MLTTLRTLAVVQLASLACLAAGAAENLLRNPDFEDLSGEDVAGWSVPSYWGGSLAPAEAEAHSGRQSALLTTSLSRGHVWGRVLHGATLPVSLAQRLRFSMWARGSGEFLLGIIRYSKRVEGEPNYHYLWQEPSVTLTDQWQEITFEFSIDDPRFERFNCCAELRGEGSRAQIDGAALRPVVLEGLRASVLPGHPLVAADGSVDIDIELGIPAGPPLPAGNILVLVLPPEGEERWRSDIPLDAAGRARFRFTPGSGTEGLWKLVFSHPASGWSQTLAADVLPPAEYARFAAAAERLPSLPQAPHYLFLGDSLTDMFRGHNYVDKIACWLYRRYGAGAGVRNAGVGGDYITRVWDRLNGAPNVHRPEMYADLYQPPPDRIFIFLGHNDSKASSRSGYTEHAVKPEVFRELYGKTLARLKAETGAPVCVISSTSSVYEITAETSRIRSEAGKANNLFGKPEHLELFNRIAAEVAAQAGCDYLDAYSPTRDTPDKRRLFIRDGVHVSNEGNRLLALLILDYLASPAED